VYILFRRASQLEKDLDLANRERSQLVERLERTSKDPVTTSTNKELEDVIARLKDDIRHLNHQVSSLEASGLLSFTH
jgi:lipid II:glycine glycyltransferase (peptidoglycan interpeptide bridge formation enzyme)